MEAEAPTALIPRVRDMLGAFLFRGDDVYKPVPVLSGGEKSRLALLRMLLKPMNLLILDEPTNHLDLYSKDILLDTLKKFTGTIIFVSHDREFMEALSTKTLELASRPPNSPNSPGGPAIHRLFYGDYGYYLERLARETAAPGTTAPSMAAPNGPADPAATSNGNPAGDPVNGPAQAEMASPAAPDSPAQAETAFPAEADSPAGTRAAVSPATALPRTFLIKAGGPGGLPGNGRLPKDDASNGGRRAAAKQQQALARRLERQEAEILQALETLEAEKAAREAELARPEVYAHGEKARSVKAKLDEIIAAIEEKTREWEAKARELEQS
jgi:ATP-binding cassette subfamily F protein 3